MFSLCTVVDPVCGCNKKPYFISYQHLKERLSLQRQMQLLYQIRLVKYCTFHTCRYIDKSTLNIEIRRKIKKYNNKISRMHFICYYLFVSSNCIFLHFVLINSAMHTTSIQSIVSQLKRKYLDHLFLFSECLENNL